MTRPLMLVALAAACTAPRPGPSAARPVEPVSEPVRLASPEAPGRPVPGAPLPARGELRHQMLAHFAAVSALQRAVTGGQLDEARRHARWLVAHDEPPVGAPDDGRPFADDLRASARAVVDAPDLPTAAALTARLGQACGRCHDARAAAISFAWEPEPAAAPSLAAQMQRHQWAAARLWEGLVGPSDEMWAEGSRVMAAMQLDAALIVPGVPRGDLAALADQVRSLARRATALTRHDERAALYGELLSTCAGCHALARRER